MDLIYREMYAKMGSAPENNALAAVFIREMYPPPLRAVRMAQNALKYDDLYRAGPHHSAPSLSGRGRAPPKCALYCGGWIVKGISLHIFLFSVILLFRGTSGHEVLSRERK